MGGVGGSKTPMGRPRLVDTSAGGAEERAALAASLPLKMGTAHSWTWTGGGGAAGLGLCLGEDDGWDVWGRGRWTRELARL